MDKRIDGLQNEIDQKFYNLQYSISRLANQQHVHQEEDNSEEECLIDTILGEQAQLQQLQEELIKELTKASEELQDAPELGVVYGPWRRKEEILPLLSEGDSGKESGEEPQKPTTQATNSPLPAAPSPDQVHILPKPAAHETHGTPTAKAIPFALPVQYFRKLLAYVQNFSITSKKLAAAHTAWHSG